MRATQFQTKPQQYGYTAYYPTQETTNIMETMMPMIMMIMMMAIVMSMLKPIMAGAS